MSANSNGPAFDPLNIEAFVRNPYFPTHDTALNGKKRRALDDSNELTKFGVNLTEMAPGSISALRPWYTEEDEFIYIIEGTPTLVNDAGAQQLQPGMCACFPTNSGDAHRLENLSKAVVLFLEVGNRSEREEVYYPDDDMVMSRMAGEAPTVTHTDGSPY
tara:strand:- start:7354 stop:7833 length:480 start_codon:yes stop_codon:yes gene_type:complete